MKEHVSFTDVVIGGLLALLIFVGSIYLAFRETKSPAPLPLAYKCSRIPISDYSESIPFEQLSQDARRSILQEYRASDETLDILTSLIDFFENDYQAAPDISGEFNFLSELMEHRKKLLDWRDVDPTHLDYVCRETSGNQQRQAANI